MWQPDSLAGSEADGDEDVWQGISPEPLARHARIWSSHSLVPANAFQGEHVPPEKKIQAIERGCKDGGRIHCPQPLAGYWEESRFMPKVGEIVSDKDRGKLAYRLAGNIIGYATGFEPPKPRLDKPKVIDPKDDKAASAARYVIELAQVKHDGGDWQPAKNALRALALNARDKYLIDVSLAKRDVRMSKSAELWPNKFLYMHGKGKFTVDEAEVTNMRAHLDLGGTLLADACCGAEAFDGAFREFAKKLYRQNRGDPGRRLPVQREAKRGSDSDYGVTARPAARRRRRSRGAAMLEGIKSMAAGGDLQPLRHRLCGWRRTSRACKGYDPDSAKAGDRALLYSLKR